MCLKGAEINHQDSQGRTALYHALEKKFVSVAKILISFGADVYITDAHGKTALDLDFSEYREVIEDAIKTQDEKNNSQNSAVYKETITLFNQKASSGIDFLLKVSKKAIFKVKITNL